MVGPVLVTFGLILPTPFGKYLLLHTIAAGGMGELWRAKEFGTDGWERLVAIKLILPDIATTEASKIRFLDEASVSVQLNHTNIARIYELGCINNSYFIAMEYISGQDMNALFKRCRKKGEPAPIPLSCYVVSKLCEGLDYAHRRQDGTGRDMKIVHRDVSPRNVLIGYDGTVKLIDFGIAKAVGNRVKTGPGQVWGKVPYMSPEQIQGLPLSGQSDVFAAGICLYELLTGQRLFVGNSDDELMEMVRKADVPKPSAYNRRIPEMLERIVLKALASDLATRYRFANELGDDLQRFLITADSVFTRKDLAKHMKSTFAKEEKQEQKLLCEYAKVRPSDAANK